MEGNIVSYFSILDRIHICFFYNSSFLLFNLDLSFTNPNFQCLFHCRRLQKLPSMSSVRGSAANPPEDVERWFCGG
ncbi:hypothetical protein Hdeb2414_s0008g00280371 [Helianthus debilis subsp. tardiflorus]